jgi:hypothetical protein
MIPVSRYNGRSGTVLPLHIQTGVSPDEVAHAIVSLVIPVITLVRQPPLNLDFVL